MTRVILFFMTFVLTVGQLMAAPSTRQAAAEELAREIFKALQSGKMSDRKPMLAADVKTLEKALEAHPDDGVIHFGLALCYSAQENRPAALRAYARAFTLSRGDAITGMLYALELKMAKQPRKSYEVYQKVVQLHPDAIKFQFGLAAMGITIQKYDEARAVVEELIRKPAASLPGSDRSTLLYMAGNCHLYQGNHLKAIESFEAALASTPRMAAALSLLGEAYLKMGDLEKARSSFDKAAAINPSIPQVLYYQGIVSEKMGKSAMAEKSFQDAYVNGKKRLRDNGEDYYLMYLVCLKLSKSEEAKGYKAEAEKLLFTYEAPWSK